MRRWVGLLAAAIMSAPAAAAAQCCGDCNADGTVGIEELVGAVNHALTGCPSPPEAVIVLQGIALPTLAATLDSDVAAGRVEVKIDTDWNGDDESDRAIFSVLAPHTWPGRVELVKNGDFLRWIVAESSGLEHDLSVRIASWRPGTHTIAASWGHGTAELSVDGTLGGQSQLGEVLLTAGSDVVVGAAGAPGTTFHRVVFSATPP